MEKRIDGVRVGIHGYGLIGEEYPGLVQKLKEIFWLKENLKYLGKFWKEIYVPEIPSVKQISWPEVRIYWTAL